MFVCSYTLNHINIKNVVNYELKHITEYGYEAQNQN